MLITNLTFSCTTASAAKFANEAENPVIIFRYTRRVNCTAWQNESNCALLCRQRHKRPLSNIRGLLLFTALQLFVVNLKTSTIVGLTEQPLYDSQKSLQENAFVTPC